MRCAIALASLAMTATAHAQEIPPPNYDHPYRGKLTIERVATSEDVDRICPGPKGEKYVIGCAFSYGDRCRIILASDKAIKEASSTYERILRHEIAHCNGWPGNHPPANTTIRPKDASK